MFSIILKKNEKDLYPYPANKIIKNYISLYGENDVILAIPGYQSTTTSRINKLCDELRRLAPTNDIYFSLGMNGGQFVKETKKTIHDSHEIIKPDILSFLKDHSKCIMFVDKDSIIDKNNILNNDIRIKAMIIGSSNISCATYVDYPARKGELDVFLLNENYFDQDDILRIKYINHNNDYVKINDGSETQLNLIISRSIEFGKDKDNKYFSDYIKSISR